MSRQEKGSKTLDSPARRMQTACQGKPFSLQLKHNSHSGERSIATKRFCKKEEEENGRRGGGEGGAKFIQTYYKMI